MPEPFDLFISYAHEDNRGEHTGKVTAIRDAILEHHRLAFPNDPLHIFYDEVDIVTGDYWKSKIFTGLERSAVMVAVLSPGYFKSVWCRKEWEAFAELELQRTYPGEAISPIYIIEHPDFEIDEAKMMDGWLRDMKNRQYVEWKPFWNEGIAALGRREVQQRLGEVHDRAWKRVLKVRLFRKQPWNIPTQTARFVGREHEIERLNQALMTRQTVGLVALNGLGGVGKTTLAFRMAQRFRDHYPGGVLQASCESIETEADFQELIYALARDHLFRTDELSPELASAVHSERARLIADWCSGDDKRRASALKVACTRFATGERKLLILDNVVNGKIVQPAALRKLFPSTHILRLLVTSRLAASELPGIECQRVDVLDAQAGVELLARWRWFSADENDPAAMTASDDYQRYCLGELNFDEASLTADDAEWKAAAGIVRRVGGLALALEVIGVDLARNPEITYKAYLAGMIRKGLLFKLEESGERVAGQIDAAVTLMTELYAPTLDRLPPLALRILEYAACLPKDAIPLDWVRTAIQNDAEVAGLAIRNGDDEPDPFLECLRLLDGEQLLHNSLGFNHRESFPLGRMHQILQEVVQQRNGEEQFAARESAIALVVDDVAVSMQRSNLIPEELPVIDALQRYVWPRLETEESLVGRIAGSLSALLLRRGDIRSAATCGLCEFRILSIRAARDPQNDRYARDVWVSLAHNGDLLCTLGGWQQARACYETAVKLAEWFAAKAPEKAGYSLDLVLLYCKMGDLYSRLGDGIQSRGFCEKALLIAERLAASAPENADYARELSVSYNRMGDLYFRLGDMIQARAFYDKALEIAERLVSRAGENREYARDLSILHNKMGDVLYGLEDWGQARVFYGKALVTAERLAVGAPENADYARDLSISCNKMGDLLRAMGDGAQARTLYEKALVIAERLAASAPDNADYTRDLWVSCVRIAQIDEENRVASFASFSRAHEILQGMIDQELFVSPEDREVLQQLKQIVNDGSS